MTTTTKPTNATAEPVVVFENPSYQAVRVAASERGMRYRNIRCAQCQEPLRHVMPGIGEDDHGFDSVQMDDALELHFRGGYGMFIDALGHDDDELSVQLCATCAQEFCERYPWAKSIVAKCISSSVGHICLDGQLHWVTIGDCQIDPDLHGWRRVWVLHTPIPAAAENESRTAFRARMASVEYCGPFDTQVDAETAAAGTDLVVREELLANSKRRTYDANLPEQRRRGGPGGGQGAVTA